MNMIEIRRMEETDLLQFDKLHTVVYNGRRKYSKEEKHERGPLDHPVNWAVGAFNGGKLLAGTWEIDFLMRFDGSSVKMTGIGGVGTLPEARKGGYIRQIFEKILPESYENGVVFSTLAPFSHDFYRKFGYEIASARNNITISSKQFSKIKPHGEFIHFFPGDDTSDLEKIHSSYIKNINHAIHRDYWPDKKSWKLFTSQDPYASGVYLYLWKNEQGEAKSYMKYRDNEDDGEHHMNVMELAFVDTEGLYGILGLVSGLSAQFGNFKWQMPDFINAWDIIGDAWGVEIDLKPREMTRVVNAKTALELMRRPGGNAQFVLETEDKNISANSGKYLVEFSAGETKVSKTSKDADITCDILTLSQLVTGYRTLENILHTRKEGFEVKSNIEILKRVFTIRPQHLTEYF